MNWFKARCNKDNFWNLMFWLGMVGSTAMSEIFDSILLMLVTVFILPNILTLFNKVTYTDDKIFLNSQNSPLTNRLPKHFGVVLGLTIFLTAFVFIPCCMFNGVILFKLTVTTLLSFALLFPTLYFTIRNCPISILFNKTAWCKEVTGIVPSSVHFDDYDRHSMSKSYLGYNKWHWTTYNR